MKADLYPVLDSILGSKNILAQRARIPTDWSRNPRYCSKLDMEMMTDHFVLRKSHGKEGRYAVYRMKRHWVTLCTSNSEEDMSMICERLTKTRHSPGNLAQVSMCGIENLHSFVSMLYYFQLSAPVHDSEVHLGLRPSQTWDGSRLHAK